MAMVALCLVALSHISAAAGGGRGSFSLPSGAAVHGAIILSDRLPSTTPAAPLSAEYNRTAHSLAARSHNYLTLQAQLPFELVKWSAVFTTACPHYPTGHRTERGLIWAHYRIWREFAHFDETLLSLYVNGSSARVESADGVYALDVEGRRWKHGQVLRQDDVIVIFEDDAVSVIDALNTTMIEELSDMVSPLLPPPQERL